MSRIIKAKPTFHNGTLYHSRLEARWAAFFTALGVGVEYEPFGPFTFPDFRLAVPRMTFAGNTRDFPVYVEIKNETWGPHLLPKRHDPAVRSGSSVEMALSENKGQMNVDFIIGGCWHRDFNVCSVSLWDDYEYYWAETFEFIDEPPFGECMHCGEVCVLTPRCPFCFECDIDPNSRRLAAAFAASREV